MLIESAHLGGILRGRMAFRSFEGEKWRENTTRWGLHFSCADIEYQKEIEVFNVGMFVGISACTCGEWVGHDRVNGGRWRPMEAHLMTSFQPSVLFS